MANDRELMKNALTFGLVFLDDGATIKRMPLINCMAMCGDTPPTVLSINDCTEHLAKGGKKDAPYIASLFYVHVEVLDASKTCTDIFFFDGASNVQKAGSLLQAKNPCAVAYHGGEYVASLFFCDLSKLGQIKVRTSSICYISLWLLKTNIICLFQKLILKACRLYNVFGSGSTHGTYAQFMEQSTLHNRGKRIHQRSSYVPLF